MKYTVQQRINIAKKVADLYTSGTYTLESCCKAVRVDYDTFRNWAAPSVDYYSLTPDKQRSLKRRGYVHEVHSIINEMKEVKEAIYNSLVLEKASLSILKILEGYYYETKVVIYKKDETGQMRPESCREYTKYKPPSTLAIIYVLEKHHNNFNKKYPAEKIDLSADEMYMARRMSDEEIATEIQKHHNSGTPVSLLR